MRNRGKRKRRRFDRPLCASFGPDDGVDPRELAKSAARAVPNRKALQLCRQVAQALNLAIPGLADPELQDLLVLDVQPFPDSSRLLVIVQSATQAGGDVALVQHQLGGVVVRLRQEVAAAIHRRRVPELVLLVQSR